MQRFAVGGLCAIASERIDKGLAPHPEPFIHEPEEPVPFLPRQTAVVLRNLTSDRTVSSEPFKSLTPTGSVLILITSISSLRTLLQSTTSAMPIKSYC